MGIIDIEKIKNKSIQIIERDYSYIDGKYLRNFRMSLNMSQALLADYFGVSKKAIEKWEQGKNAINGPIARLIFLIEKDPKLLSLLKEVRTDNALLK
ncbi:MAG: type II toxin-antitoxin system MqsA family antitoxin [Anaeroplasmataceae bacterium]|nr:type II toxin-antitoxin system MqsA family antitoxin [Anaeroplasmataceae bacterium]